MWRLFNVLRHDIVTGLLNGRITVEDFYRQLYATTVLVAGAIFALSLMADIAGFNGLNIVLIPVWVIIVGYFGFHPTHILVTLTAGGASSLGRDIDRQRIVEGIKAASENWRRFVLHLAMFGGVFFLTRFMVPVRNYPFAGILLLGAVMTLGLWSWLYAAGGTAYKYYVLVLVFISIVIGVFGTFAGKPAKDGHPIAPVINGIVGVVEDSLYAKTLEVEVSSLSEEVEVCCIKPGIRKFSVPGRQFVLLLGTNTSAEINGKVRVNGARASEEFEVATDGKVKVKFVGPPEFLRQPIDWQELTVEFR